jgi:hypothetical protein
MKKAIAQWYPSRAMDLISDGRLVQYPVGRGKGGYGTPPTRPGQTMDARIVGRIQRGFMELQTVCLYIFDLLSDCEPSYGYPESIIRPISFLPGALPYGL